MLLHTAVHMMKVAVAGCMIVATQVPDFARRVCGARDGTAARAEDLRRSAGQRCTPVTQYLSCNKGRWRRRYSTVCCNDTMYTRLLAHVNACSTVGWSVACHIAVAHRRTVRRRAGIRSTRRRRSMVSSSRQARACAASSSRAKSHSSRARRCCARTGDLISPTASSAVQRHSLPQLTVVSEECRNGWLRTRATVTATV